MPIVSTYKIIGFDPDRPPKVESFPCIYLYFQLDEQPPAEWYEELVRLTKKSPYPVEMDKEKEAVIHTWVRKPAEIEGLLVKLKAWIAECNEAYDSLVNAPTAVVTADGKVVAISPAQAELNAVVESLDFD